MDKEQIQPIFIAALTKAKKGAAEIALSPRQTDADHGYAESCRASFRKMKPKKLKT